MDIKEIITTYAPIVSNVLVSIGLPLLIKKAVMNWFKNKINETTSEKDYNSLIKEIREVKKEIRQMRGKE